MPADALAQLNPQFIAVVGGARGEWYFDSCVPVGTSNQVIEHRVINGEPLVQLIPGDLGTLDMVCTRNLTADRRVAEWRSLVEAGNGQVPYEGLELTFLDATVQPVARWFLEGAWPSRLEVLTGTNGAQEVVHIVIDRAERVGVMGNPGSNDPPAANGANWSTDEDVATTGSVSVGDPNGDSLTLSVATAPVQGAAAVVSSDPPQLRYTPGPNFHGTDTFSYRVTDARGASAVAQVIIQVTAVNDAPAAVGLAVDAEAGVNLDLTLPGSDVDGDLLRYTVEVAPGHGTVISLDELTGLLTYRADADYVGEDELWFSATDNTLTSSPARVTITVRAPLTDGGTPDAGTLMDAGDRADANALQADAAVPPVDAGESNPDAAAPPMEDAGGSLPDGSVLTDAAVVRDAAMAVDAAVVRDAAVAVDASADEARDAALAPDAARDDGGIASPGCTACSHAALPGAESLLWTVMLVLFRRRRTGQRLQHIPGGQP